jgi:hypothetical protein
MSIRPGTEGSALLKTEYDADIRTKAYEMPKLIADFDKPAGISKVGNLLTVRIIPTGTLRTLLSTGEGTGLTYETATTLSVTASPVGRYMAVEIPDHLVSKMVDGEEAQTKKKYRDILLSGVKEGMDAYAGSTLAPGISTAKGPANFDKAGLLDAKQSLRINAKEHYDLKTSQVHVKYHPSQIKHIESISEIMNADARGDSENPNVSGYVVKAWGMTFSDAGTIYSAAGVVYNMLHLKSAFVAGYNQVPYLKNPQDYELVVRFICYGEMAVVEVFDEDAVLFKSAA